MSDLIFRGAMTAQGQRTDLRISRGRIVESGSGVSNSAAESINVDGLVVLTGLVDLHTHLREPGFEASETVKTGSVSAAFGGYTTVHAMANTNPVADSAPIVEHVQSLGERAGLVTVRPVGAVTKGLNGESLSEIGSMAKSRANVRVFSDDGKCVWNSKIMRRALSYVSNFGGAIAQHAQDPFLTEDAQMNEGRVSAELGLTGWPASAEESIIYRDLLLAKETGARLHICHVSTAESVDLIRWGKKKGISVTAEVTPHHLLLTDDAVHGYDARFKVNPPLRSEEDTLALRAGLADGTIDAIATDHAPHPVESKDVEWQNASFGMVGLESALSIAQSVLVDSGLLDWADIERIMSQNPARIGQLSNHPTSISVGEVADLVFYDPTKTSTFTTASLHGKSQNSPYLGLELPGQVVSTVRHGRFTVREGKLVEPASERTETEDWN